MSESDGIPVGLDQLLAYLREMEENTARLRALTARIKEDTRQAELASQEVLLGKRAASCSSTPDT